MSRKVVGKVVFSCLNLETIFITAVAIVISITTFYHYQSLTPSILLIPLQQTLPSSTKTQPFPPTPTDPT